MHISTEKNEKHWEAYSFAIIYEVDMSPTVFGSWMTLFPNSRIKGEPWRRVEKGKPHIYITIVYYCYIL